MNTCVKVGCTVLFSHASIDIVCARAHGSAGSSPAFGQRPSMYDRIARICVSGLPSTSSIGTWPSGFIARYSGVLCSPLCNFTCA